MTQATFTVHAIQDIDNTTKAIFMSPHRAYKAFEQALDEGATDIDLYNDVDAIALLSELEYPDLPNLMDDETWYQFARHVRGIWKETQDTQPPADESYSREGVQPDLPVPVAERILMALDHYAPPRFPETQYAIEATEIIMASRHDRAVQLEVYSDTSLQAPSYQLNYQMLPPAELVSAIEKTKHERAVMAKQASASEQACYNCNAEIALIKLEFALDQLRPGADPYRGPELQ